MVQEAVHMQVHRAPGLLDAVHHLHDKRMPPVPALAPNGAAGNSSSSLS